MPAAEAELASERAERQVLEASVVHASATLGSADGLAQVGGGDAGTGDLRGGGSVLTPITAPPVAHNDGALAALSDSALAERGAQSTDSDEKDIVSEEGARRPTRRAPPATAAATITPSAGRAWVCRPCH